MRLQKKTAIVTGASRGIGRAIAECLAAEGSNVALVDVLSDEVQATAKEIADAHGVQTLGLTCDVTDYAAVESMIEEVLGTFETLDILVNNAGITRDNLLLRMKPEDFDAVINVNLKGVFNCMKAVARPMLRQRSGAIVNIASVIGFIGNPGQVNYGASKAGVLSMTKTVSRELASKGIRVNAVAPGFIQTEMTDRIPEKAREAMVAKIPLKCLGQPEDVGKATVFLASDEARYVTGQVLVVDGGMIA